MSCTELFKIPEKGPIQRYRDFRNSYRGAWLVWDQMSVRYLGHKPSMMGNMQPVWDLWKDEQVPLNDRIVMASTFDKVLVRRENLPRLVEAIEDYATRFDPGTLRQQARALHELAADESCFAVCWNQTSVNADAWYVERENEINEDGDYWFIFDISKDYDYGYWFLFDGIEHEMLSMR